MHSATTATGTVRQELRTSVAATCTARLATVAAHRPAAPKAELTSGNLYPEQTFIQRARNCMKQNEKTFSTGTTA